MGTRLIEMAGKRYGRLIVIDRVPPHPEDTVAYWNCICDCGKHKIIAGGSLRKGFTSSCGCYNSEIARARKIHGRLKTPEYKAWQKAKSRCTCDTDPSYKNYGSRGIWMCERWLNSPKDFLDEMGVRPKDKNSIDRIDNEKGYCCGKCDDCHNRGIYKTNCRWADYKEQSRNTRHCVYINISRTNQDFSRVVRNSKS